MLAAIISIVYGLALGALVGIERERNIHKSKETSFAGVRTFGIIGMMGALSALSYNYFNFVLLAWILGLGVLGLIVSAYIVSHFGQKKYGITSEAAALMVFGVGFLCGVQQYVIGAIVAVLLVLMLGFKDYIHFFANSMTEEEEWSLIKFVIIAAVVLPLLPNYTIDPWGIVNPYQIWFLVVLIAGISALSYVGIKMVGYKKGLTWSGFLGGLVSSTAVTLTFSKLSKELPKRTLNIILFGILIASSAMYFRVLLEVTVVNPKLFENLSVPLIFSGMWLCGAAFFLYKSKKEAVLKEEDLGIKNPVDLLSAMKFGLLFTLVLVMTSFAKDLFGDTGLLIVSGISGLVDTDAISLSLASLAKSEISLETASLGVVIATASNMIIKLIFVNLLAVREVRYKFNLIVAINVALMGVITYIWVL